LTIDSVKSEGNMNTLNVNVIGTLNFARVAAVFLRDGLKKGEQDRSMVLLSSVNAFRESPGLYLYQTGKHAVQGLLRSSRKTLWERDGIRINAINPGVTDTPMAATIAAKFREAGLYVQDPESVAHLIVGMMVTEDMVGKSVYVEGGDGWEFEDSFYREQPRWLGEEPTRRMRVNAEAVQKGALVPKE
jgi:NAD(P)-dependent dehydrogenase (short-subunit alcohol dehydrogenase family)